MRKFEISDRFTTSDIGLDLEADSLEELFAAGAEGMLAIIFSRRPAGKITHHSEITLTAPTAEQLLVDWLSELLYLFDAEALIAHDYKLSVVRSPSGYELKGQVGWQPFRPVHDPAEHEVKAVTYYKLKIENDDGIYRCHVVFDL